MECATLRPERGDGFALTQVLVDSICVRLCDTLACTGIGQGPLFVH